jgi:hypothetical protein
MEGGFTAVPFSPLSLRERARVRGRSRFRRLTATSLDLPQVTAEADWREIEPVAGTTLPTNAKS